MSYKIVGRITAMETGEPLSGLKVTAWDKDAGYLDELLGEVISDTTGQFIIEYSEDDFKQLGFDRKPDIYIIITNQKGGIIYSSKSAIRHDAGKDEAFNIQIPLELLDKAPDMSPDDVFSDLLRRIKE